ncbi:DgyrCDS3388 [Dimorphilus gyrociliatus]|uniref:Oxysterol-binding protein n=1 Tax=Dimorphilus gyrociliatus TaxID=2664684 RepID=A0A7I8VEZ9_9ANNE|nr:DgyrCDS3388 [Dimorphilus gyrociliatus]
MFSEATNSNIELDEGDSMSGSSNVDRKSRRESLGNTQFTGLRGQNNTRFRVLFSKLINKLLLNRKRLPVPMFSRNNTSIFSLLRQCIGKDLSKITMPVTFNEPLSFLQRLSEYLESSYLIDNASDSTDPIHRMEFVTAFAVSALSSNHERLGKPFNPLLGETYELVREDLGFSLVAEQVSHHPPISAFHAESSSYTFSGSISPAVKYTGKNVDIRPEGFVTLHLKKWNETYVWSNIACRVHNIFIGKLWIEHYGKMKINCVETGWSSELEFHKSYKDSFWSSHLYHIVDGHLYDEKQQKKRSFCGQWIDCLYSFDSNAWRTYEKTLKRLNETVTGLKRMCSLSNQTFLRSTSEESDCEASKGDVSNVLVYRRIPRTTDVVILCMYFFLVPNKIHFSDENEI